MAQKTDPGVKMGNFKNELFNDANVNVLKGLFEAQQVKLKGRVA